MINGTARGASEIRPSSTAINSGIWKSKRKGVVIIGEREEKGKKN